VISVGSVAIFVADLERSAAFYEQVVGLDVLARIDTPEVREVIVGARDKGSQLMLAHRRGAAPLDPTSGFWKVYLDVDDVEGSFRRLVDAGAEVVAEPRLLERWNLSIALVKDPDGYLLELGQRHGDPAGTHPNTH